MLVTVDRHEWYAPPRIYTRDDSTGLWIAKPAFQPDCLFLSSGAKDAGNLASHPISLTGERACGGDVGEGNLQELVDGVPSLETNYEDLSERVTHHNGSDGIVNKQRVDGLSTDGSVADISLNESEKSKLEKSGAIQDDGLMDFQGANAATANASGTERVIESTLVNFEVVL